MEDNVAWIGSAIGVAIALAIVTYALRGKRSCDIDE